MGWLASASLAENRERTSLALLAAGDAERYAGVPAGSSS